MEKQKNFPFKWYALIGLSLLSFTAFLDFTIVTTALPFIQKDLKASVLQLQWVTNIMAMVFCMFMIVAGKIGDLFGRKKIYYFGFFFFTIAAIGAATSNSIQSLILFRGIQAFAGAIISTVGVALLPQAFPEKEHTRAIGIFSAFNGAGLALGPFIGGVLITLFSWRWVFWVNIPFIIIGLSLCSFSLKPSPKPAQNIQIDWYGFMLLAAGLGCLIYGIIHGEQTGWDLLTTWGFISIGILALTSLWFVEKNTVSPLLDLSLFKNPYASLAIILCISAGIVVFVLMFFDSLYLNLMRHQSAFLVGVTLVCVPVAQVLVSLILEFLVKRWGVLKLLIFGLITALFSTICHLFFTPTVSIVLVILALIPLGYTWGIANAGSITGLAESIPPEKMGSAIGTIFTFWNLSGSIFLAISTIIFHWRQNLVMNYGLAQQHLPLTNIQYQQIQTLIADPEQAQNILTFFGSNSNAVTQLFMSSFMHGFYWVMGFCAIVMTILLAIALKIYRKTSQFH